MSKIMVNIYEGLDDFKIIVIRLGTFDLTI